MARLCLVTVFCFTSVSKSRNIFFPPFCYFIKKYCSVSYRSILLSVMVYLSVCVCVCLCPSATPTSRLYLCLVVLFFVLKIEFLECTQCYADLLDIRGLCRCSILTSDMILIFLPWQPADNNQQNSMSACNWWYILSSLILCCGIIEKLKSNIISLVLLLFKLLWQHRVLNKEWSTYYYYYDYYY